MKSLQVLCLIFCGVSLVSSFSWTTCGNETYSMKVVSLDVFSNSTKVLYVTGRGKVANNITTPIQGKVEMYKKFFWGWTLIPCIENIGSCVYNNICDLSPFVEDNCPQEFKENDLPCKCPILQGQYVAKRFPIDLKLLPTFIENGKYRIKVTLTKDNANLLCLIMDIIF